jgi:hypothetical protein
VVDCETGNPDGRWTWLTGGRPPRVAEVLLRRLSGDPRQPRDMRDAPAGTRPAVNEPLAAAVGLEHAGQDVGFDLIVEAIEKAGLEPYRVDRDPAASVLIETIERIKQAGTTVVLVSHRFAMMRVVDRIGVLRDGRLEKFGPRDEILQTLQAVPQPPQQPVRKLVARVSTSSEASA